MSSLRAITFERGGFPVELTEARDWRRAIERGQLARETLVTQFRGPGPGQMMSAAQVPELLAIFEALDPQTAAPAPPPAPEPSVEEAISAPPSPWAEAEADAEATAPALDEEPRRFAPSPPPAPLSAPVVVPGPLKAAGWILAILVLLLLIGRCGSGPAPVSAPAPTTNITNDVLMDEPLVDPAPATFPTSFDCGAAALAVERTICASRSLAAQDREMARLFGALMAQPDIARTALEQEQSEWLSLRNACGDEASPESCLSRLYAERIAALHGWRAPAGPEGDMLEDPRVPRNTEVPPRPQPRAPAATSETVHCVLPDGGEVNIPFDQCRARSGVTLAD